MHGREKWAEAKWRGVEKCSAGVCCQKGVERGGGGMDLVRNLYEEMEGEAW